MQPISLKYPTIFYAWLPLFFCCFGLAGTEYYLAETRYWGWTMQSIVTSTVAVLMGLFCLWIDVKNRF